MKTAKFRVNVAGSVAEKAPPRSDMTILVELQRNGRMTNVTLAERVGLSASP